jgi:hypothetical protein
VRLKGRKPCRREGNDVRKIMRKRGGEETKGISRSLRLARDDLFEGTKKVGAQGPGKRGEGDILFVVRYDGGDKGPPVRGRRPSNS